MKYELKEKESGEGYARFRKGGYYADANACEIEFWLEIKRLRKVVLDMATEEAALRVLIDTNQAKDDLIDSEGMY